MFSLSLNMKFWDDGQPDSTRIRNVKFSWNELKKLSSYLNANGITTEASLYDFSPEQIISDAIHISYPLGVYKKAEKTNIILKDDCCHNICPIYISYSDTFLAIGGTKNDSGGIFLYQSGIYTFAGFGAGTFNSVSLLEGTNSIFIF